MRQCIYCRQTLNGTVPAEHLIPQGFGRFTPDLTLDCVCSACNGFFGRALEWPMRNTSHEGVLRFHHGLGTGQVGNIGTKGIELTVAEAGDWSGARVILKVDRRGNTYREVIPQVGARRNSSEPWTWYLEKDLSDSFAAKYPKDSEFHIIGREDEKVRLEERLLRIIPTYTRKGDTHHRIGGDGKVLLHFEKEFEAAVRRCLAKIAFDYLAYIRGEEFALDEQFDEARAFVRCGTEPSHGIGVYVNMKPILTQELLSGMRISDGHVLTLEGRTSNTSGIEVRLSLFNSIRYRIVLSRTHGGLWFAVGHHFDIISRKVTELRVTVPIHTL